MIAPAHAIRTLTADRVDVDLEPFFSVSVTCVCGEVYPGVPVAELTGVLDVAMQMFFAHVAATTGT